MSVAWQQQRERGGHRSLRLMVWIALSLGRAPARALLYPICFYFLVGFRSARQAIRRFRERVLNRPVSWLELFHHYHAFASTILDQWLASPIRVADFRPLSYYPLSLWSWQDTIKAVFLDRVSVISEYERKIHSPSFEMRLPSVVSYQLLTLFRAASESEL